MWLFQNYLCLKQMIEMNARGQALKICGPEGSCDLPDVRELMEEPWSEARSPSVHPLFRPVGWITWATHNEVGKICT